MIGTEVVRRSRGLHASGVVGERSNSGEAEAASDRGAVGSEYPDMSNDKSGKNPLRRKDKVSRVKFVCPGLVGS